MANALVYSKEGVHREKISKAVMPLGLKPSFTADTTLVTNLIAEVSPVLFFLDWHSLDHGRNAQLLRAVANSDGEGKIIRVICCESTEPGMLALASETGIRKIVPYATIGLELKKVASMVQVGATDGQKFMHKLTTLREAGKMAEAEKFIEESFQKNSPLIEAQLEYGNLALSRGDLKTPHDIAMELLKGDKLNVRAMNLLSRVAMKKGDFATASKVLAHANVLSPKNPERLALLGNVYYGQGDKEKAKSVYEESLKEDPHSKEAVTGLGTIALEDGDTQTLVDLFSAHSSEDETAGFFNNAAVQNVREGKLQESLNLYEIALKALKTDRFKGQIYFNIALNQRRLGNLEDAHKAIKRSIKYDGNLDKAKNQLAEIEGLLAKKSA